MNVGSALSATDSSKPLPINSRSSLLSNVNSKLQSMNVVTTGETQTPTCPARTLTWTGVTGDVCQAPIRAIAYGSRYQVNTANLNASFVLFNSNFLKTSIGNAIAFCDAGNLVIESSTCNAYTLNNNVAAMTTVDKQQSYRKLSAYKHLIGRSINIDEMDANVSLNKPRDNITCSAIVTITDLGWPKVRLIKIDYNTGISSAITRDAIEYLSLVLSGSSGGHHQCSIKVTPSGVTLIGQGIVKGQKW